MHGYNHREIEKKWQKKWREEGTFDVGERDLSKEKEYILVEFPYPSGNLHIGHWYAFSVTDIYARYKRMLGKQVLFPMGFDAFGLPAENAAIKRDLHPKEWTEGNIKYMRDQLDSMGAAFSWDKTLSSTDPSYYKWSQWTFTEFFKKGLAYKGTGMVNWCPSCNTVIANEQVVGDNECERCGTTIEKKEMPQWMYKITDYADRLLNDLNGLDWPEPIKEAQRQWIGKSEGAELSFETTAKKGNVVIVHGCNSNEKGSTTGTPENLRHWKAWLQKNLEERGYEVSNDLYPTDWKPDFTEWKKVFEKNTIDEHTTLVGHSCGTAFILRWLQETKTKVKRVVLVAPSIIETEKYKDVDFKNFELNQSTKDYVGDLVVFYSENDHVKNVGASVSDVQEKLGGKIIHQADRGHYILDDMGTEEFPELLDAITDGINVFTTRPDTLFGATFLVIAPEHELVDSFKPQINNWEEVEKYRNKTASKSDVERMENKEKTGIELQGIKAINPATKEEIPMYIADYVLAGYGTGAIMAVPAHDERDNEFATKMNVPIKQVVACETGIKRDNEEFRRGGCGVVFDPQTQKYAVAVHPDGFVGFFAGGIEKGEDVKEGILREITEEGGLYDFGHVEVIHETYAHYYNNLKDLNRVAHATCLLIVLNSADTKPVQLEDHENFELGWMTAEEVLSKLKEHNKDSNVDHWITDLEASVSRAIELGYDTTSDKSKFVHSIHSGSGILVNSGEFDGLTTEEAKEKVTKFVGGEMKSTYRLRDWSVGRQRYWGVPIPIVYDPEGKAHPIPLEHLPWTLPEDVDPKPTGEPPLAKSKELKERTERIFGKGWAPEVETMDTFLDSSWYFLRYIDNENDEELVSKKKQEEWMPIDIYFGGAEHTTLHLLYSRFWQKALFDLGYVIHDEPYKKRINRGIILGPDGKKMSKSKGNVVDPDDQVERVGADSVRMYLGFVGPYGEVTNYPFDLGGIAGVRRFLEKVWRNGEKVSEDAPQNEALLKLLHKTVKKVRDDMAKFQFNTATSAMMILVSEFDKQEALPQEYFEMFLKLLAPFAPHMTEELWANLGHSESIHNELLPEYDEKMLVEDTITMAIQINGKVRDTIDIAPDTSEEDMLKLVKASSKIQKWIEGKEIKKFIYKPGKIANLVVVGD